MKTANKILIDYGLKKQLLKLGSYPTIDRALAGDVRTPQKLTIRKKALELGGVEVHTEQYNNDRRDRIHE